MKRFVCFLFVLVFVAASAASAQQMTCAITSRNPVSSTATINVGDKLDFASLYGTAPYTWSVNNSQVVSGNALPFFSYTFTTAGSIPVVVRDGQNRTAQCNVAVQGSSAPPPTSTMSATHTGNFVVGGTATITVSTTSGQLFGKPIAVQVTVGGLPISPSWSNPPTTMPLSGVAVMVLNLQAPGNYVVQITINGVSQSVMFTVNGPTPPPPPPPLPPPSTGNCTVTPANPLVNQGIVFYIPGAPENGRYEWSSVGVFSSQVTYAPRFSYSFPNPGTYTVNFTGTVSGSCTVTVGGITSLLSCPAARNPTFANENFTLTGSGGIPPYSFLLRETDDARIISLSGTSITVRYGTPGTKSITVSDSGPGTQKQATTCLIQVFPSATDPVITHLTHGATFVAMNVLIPDSIMTLKGANLSAGQFVAQTKPLPTELGGVRVWLDDTILLPLYHALPAQISFQAPHDLGAGNHTIHVDRAGVKSNRIPIAGMRRYDLGMFEYNSADRGRIPIVANWPSYESMNGPNNPAASRVLILVGTGMPFGTPLPPGSAAPPTPLVYPESNVRVTVDVDGREYPNVVVVLMPDQVGLWQFNVNLQGIPAIGGGKHTGRIIVRDLAGNELTRSQALDFWFSGGPGF